MTRALITRAHELVERAGGLRLPGLAVAVGVRGDLVWSQVYGVANHAPRTPVCANTRFRVGSVSKPLAACGLALLVERGQLDLDRAVQAYLPDFPHKGHILTLRALAGHLSGIRNYRGTEASSCLGTSLRESVRMFADDPLEAAPGERFQYSSYNWILLGAIMEIAAQQEFVHFMAEHVLGPLGMACTVPDDVDTNHPSNSASYEATPLGGYAPTPDKDLRGRWPAGGYRSTAEDLVRFGSAHLQAGFLRGESLRQLFAPQKTSAGKQTPYGLGWFVGPDAWFHGGDVYGGNAILWVRPSRGVVVALVSNGGQVLLKNGKLRDRASAPIEKLVFPRERLAQQLIELFGR